MRNLFKKKRIEVVKKYLKKKNPIILEIGVHKGDFYQLLLENFEPEKLVLVDPWNAESNEDYNSSLYGNLHGDGQNIQDSYYNDVLKKFEKEINNSQIEILRKKSSDAFRILNYEFDLIYIDGNHLFEFVIEDINNSLKIIKENGYIILDDYKIVGWWNDGVTKAINKFKEEKKIKIIHQHNFFNKHNQCLIKKI